MKGDLENSFEHPDHGTYPVGIEAAINDVKRQQAGVDHRLTHARRVLVPEAVSVFGVEDSDEGWRIAGLALPLPHDIKSQPSANA